MIRLVACVVLFVCMVPHTVDASVYISEIAWMGSAENANAEWIELYNDGPAQDLRGWVLTTVDGKPSIPLTGVLARGAYGLLERMNDNTVPTVTARAVYTGNLANSGEVVVLRDAQGVTVDTVDGSNAWAIGGNNKTKETLQRLGTSSNSVWGTAPATPGASAPARRVETVSKAVSVNERTVSTSRAVTTVSPSESMPTRDDANVSVSESSASSEVFIPASATVAALAYAGIENHGTPLWWYLIGLGACIGMTVSIVFLLRVPSKEEKEYIMGYEIESEEPPTMYR